MMTVANEDEAIDMINSRQEDFKRLGSEGFPT